MLHYYSVKNLLAYREPGTDLEAMHRALAGPRQDQWVNLGGQLVPGPDVVQLIADIKSGVLKDWQAVHGRYRQLWAEYPMARQKHAYAVLCELLEVPRLTPAEWNAALDKAVDIQRFICEQVYLSRKKDYDNPFRKATYRNEAEQKAVVGDAEGNSFVQQVTAETEAFEQRAERQKTEPRRLAKRA
jgi:hypothetical protein